MSHPVKPNLPLLYGVLNEIQQNLVTANHHLRIGAEGIAKGSIHTQRKRKREDAMNRMMCTAAATILATAGVATADSVLQLDVNSIKVQARNAGGQNSSFGGLSHTGSIAFSFQAGTTVLANINVQENNQAPVNQNFTGSLTNFTGVINLNNGQVTGGNLGVFVNGDSYTASVTPNVGAVSNFIGGGFKVEGLTFNGMFTDASFGNVNVAPWFNAQSMGGLLGSFLQFNFTPDATGMSFADMDIFVSAQVIPLPPAAWTGIATLTGLMVAGYVRRRR
jgi:hypothetical protein